MESKRLNLLVICEPNYLSQKKSTRNRSTNEILSEYSEYFNEVHCLCPGERSEYNLPSSLNVKFHTLGNYRGNKIQKTLYLLRNNKKYMDKLISYYKIDIIQFRIPSTFSMSLYNDVKNIKLSKTVYIAGDIYLSMINSFGRFPFISYIARFFEKLQNRLVKETIAVCTGDILRVKYSHLNNDIHPYYSTTHRDVIRDNMLRDKTTFSLLYLGRIDYAKRLEDLLEAVSILDKDSIDVSLNILGTGTDEIMEKMRSMVSSLDIKGCVNFAGYISDKQVIDDYLLKSTILVLPSITEGTAKVLPEAMSRGVIPIAIKGTGSNDFIIENSVNGFLINPKDPQELSDTIKLLYFDKKLRAKVQVGCYEYAEKMTIQNEILKLWEFVINKYEDARFENN